MTKPPVQGLNTYLLLRVVDTIRMRMRCQSAPLFTNCNLPSCFQFNSGHLCGSPTINDICLTPTRGGCCLDATLLLPVSLNLMRECDCCTIGGTISLPIQAMLRCSCSTPLQFVPQADICITDVHMAAGALCVVFDITLTIFSACLSPVQLPVMCAPVCNNDCGPIFNMPLYPQLPNRC